MEEPVLTLVDLKMMVYPCRKILYHSKNDGLPLHISIWNNLKNTTLNEKSKS
jgi:hypothetical protein